MKNKKVETEDNVWKRSESDGFYIEKSHTKTSTNTKKKKKMRLMWANWPLTESSIRDFFEQDTPV